MAPPGADHTISLAVFACCSPGSFNMDYRAVHCIGKCIRWVGTHQQLEEILR